MNIPGAAHIDGCVFLSGPVGCGSRIWRFSPARVAGVVVRSGLGLNMMIRSECACRVASPLPLCIAPYRDAYVLSTLSVWYCPVFVLFLAPRYLAQRGLSGSGGRNFVY